MAADFYDKVAKRFGGYAYGKSGTRYTTEFPKGTIEPEDDFKSKLIDLSGSKKTALDVGCGDCKFAFGMAKYFKKIIGIDTSRKLLKVAEHKQKEMVVNNVSFFLKDATKTDFKEESFDVAFSRRGPTPFNEIFRLLNKGGHFLVIGIGEKDCVEIKKVFGRGQNYGGWDKSVIKAVKSQAKRIGFEVKFIEEYFYHEYYKSYADLELFLQGVPIFEDFDPEKDKRLLGSYVKKFSDKQGIQLERHRVVFVLKKLPLANI